jgi:hypothetical protein
MWERLIVTFCEGGGRGALFRQKYTPPDVEQLVMCRLAYTTHALNHILKTRAKILINNTKHEKRGTGC